MKWLTPCRGLTIYVTVAVATFGHGASIPDPNTCGFDNKRSCSISIATGAFMMAVLWPAYLPLKGSKAAWTFARQASFTIDIRKD